ncbi:MAG TPA: hypothetical protein VIM14_21550, partial [Polyangia bacterium]
MIRNKLALLAILVGTISACGRSALRLPGDAGDSVDGGFSTTDAKADAKQGDGFGTSDVQASGDLPISRDLLVSPDIVGTADLRPAPDVAATPDLPGNSDTLRIADVAPDTSLRDVPGAGPDARLADTPAEASRPDSTIPTDVRDGSTA